MLGPMEVDLEDLTKPVAAASAAFFHLVEAITEEPSPLGAVKGKELQRLRQQLAEERAQNQGLRAAVKPPAPAHAERHPTEEGAKTCKTGPAETEATETWKALSPDLQAYMATPATQKRSSSAVAGDREAAPAAKRRLSAGAKPAVEQGLGLRAELKSFAADPKEAGRGPAVAGLLREQLLATATPQRRRIVGKVSAAAAAAAATQPEATDRPVEEAANVAGRCGGSAVAGGRSVCAELAAPPAEPSRLDLAVLAQAKQLGLHVKLKTLATNPKVAEIRASTSMVLSALRNASGSVVAAKRALLSGLARGN